MPQDAPGSLSRQEYVDIITFILEKNDAAAGETELSADEDTLRAIVLTNKSPR